MSEHVEQQFFPIFLESVIVNTILAFDLYIYNRSENKYVLYRSRHTQFVEKHRQNLLKNNVSSLFITTEDLAHYKKYIEKNLSQIVDSPTLKTEEKANIIYQSARNLMEEVMAKPLVSDSIKRSRRFVKNTVRYILKEKDYFFSIIHLTSHDYYTYTHSINVCIYSLSLARRLNIISPYQLNLIGTGALLHDIGKSTIPQEILLKRGPLTSDEWKIIKEHPLRGLSLLRVHKTLNPHIIEIVRSHHEKLDGSGYPDGLIGKEVPLFARIACVADIFDALNTNRPYKKAADTFHSLEIMNEQFDGKIDKDIFREFVLLFKREL